MRLLRTTTTDPTGVFNSFLNQDLVISPYSKIALGMLAASVQNDAIVIDASNNFLTFSTTAGDDRRIAIAQGAYNSNNFSTLLEDIEKKMNAAVGNFAIVNESGADKKTIKSPSNIGKQTRVSTGNDGKLSIDIFQSSSWSHQPELLNNVYKDSGVAQLEFSGTTEATYQLKSVTDAVDLTFAHSTYYSHPIAKGCGIHRVRVGNITGDNTNNAGFTIGLCNVDPSTFMASAGSKGLEPADLTYGISCADPFTTGVYSTVKDGVSTATTIVPNNPIGGAANIRDVVSIEIVNGKIRLVVYQNDPLVSQRPFTRILFEEPYNGTDDLFGTITVNGKSSAFSLTNLKYTGNPYTDSSTSPTQFVDENVAELGASTPARQRRTATINSITFPAKSLASYFGYNNTTITLPAVSINVSFVADSLFKAAVITDMYLVEMLNIQLESYDTFEQGRKNILSIIPYDDENGVVAYDASNLIFLDLNNKEPINLTSIKMRLIRGDYTTPTLQGLTSAVLYIKSKDE